MERVALTITYRPASGRRVPIAHVECGDLITAAAEIAIREAYERAEAISSADPLLGRIEIEEAQRLKRTLAMLIPTLQETSRDREELITQ